MFEVIQTKTSFTPPGLQKPSRSQVQAEMTAFRALLLQIVVEDSVGLPLKGNTPHHTATIDWQRRNYSSILGGFSEKSLKKVATAPHGRVSDGKKWNRQAARRSGAKWWKDRR